MQVPSSVAALVLCNEHGRIAYVSPTAAHNFGAEAAMLEGQSLDVLIPTEYRESHWKAFWQAMQSGVCKIDRAAFHLPVLCHDGATRVFQARFVFLLDPTGHATGAIVVFGPCADGAIPLSAIVEEQAN